MSGRVLQDASPSWQVRRRYLSYGALPTVVLFIGVLALAGCVAEDDDAGQEASLSPTPVPTVTPQSELQPTPEATATPALPAVTELLYQADFAAWRRGRGENVPPSEADIYPIGTPEQTLVGYTDIEPWTDTRTDVELRLVSETKPTATGCLLTRYVAGVGYYSLCMNADGTTAAFYREPDATSEQVLLNSEAREEGLDPSQWTTLSIIAREGDLWFLINDQLAGTATHEGPTEGGIGLYVQTDGPDAVEYEFRKLTVRAIE